MKGRSDVAHRIADIQEIFQDARRISEEEASLRTLEECLERVNPEFRSVAYEGASMGLAIKDLSSHAAPQNWRAFLAGPGARHKTQVHIGMGLALARNRMAAPSFLNTLDRLLSFRVYDGCGFYDGMFRLRHTVDLQLRSNEIPEKYFHAYDLGVGRSLWYSHQGIPETIAEIIGDFSAERRQDLWFGIGIACTYVGGFEDGILKELALSAGNYALQLAKGAALAARSRIQAGSLTDYAEKACIGWCGRSAAEAMQLTIDAEPAKLSDPELAFTIWLSRIESALTHS